MNFNDHTVTWDTDTISLKNRGTCTLSSVEDLIEVYMNTNESQTLRYEYSRSNQILDTEYKQIFLQAQMMSSRHVRTSM
jgi:hypothetical protein